MRVDWLYLKDFRNLYDFEMDFDLSSERQVVVGRNSVGKSNVLEALAWIFRDLDLEEDSGFEYKIKEWAKRGQSRCKENKSCNLGITKHAIRKQK